MKGQNLATVTHIHVFLSNRGKWETPATAQFPVLSLVGGWGGARREGSLFLINTDPEPQPLFNSFYIFLFIQKQLTFTKTFLS